jgi:cytochrome d ubiquinol oxidase subunit II
MIFDYETIRVIWWGILGLVLIGFSVTGGFDLGIGILLPFLGKNDDERRVILNSIGPTWEGNQVWFVLAGAILFAAWPMAYAVSFSSMYLALLLTLFTLFLRPLGFDYRSKITNQKWRNNWDIALFIGSFVPALVFGIAFGNLFTGIPFHLENDLRIVYLGSFWSLLTPFTLLTGLLGLSMFVMRGAIYLQIKTQDIIHQRAKNITLFFTLSTLILFACAGFWITFLDGYHISSELFSDTPSNPLLKTVKRLPGLWLDNFGHFPDLWIIPTCAFISSYLTLLFSIFSHPGKAYLFSSLTIATIILTAGCSLFPFIIPSSISFNSSLTVWDSSSSLKTLTIMFWVTTIFLPLILVYVSWVFRVLRGKITVEHIHKHNHTAY